jgi:galactokinase
MALPVVEKKEPEQKVFVQNLFEQQFKHPTEIVCHAPGRVNLIGDHTDYNNGFVLPAAIHHYCVGSRR